MTDNNHIKVSISLVTGEKQTTSRQSKRSSVVIEAVAELTAQGQDVSVPGESSHATREQAP